MFTQQQLTNMRRTFHKHAEPSDREEHTARMLMNHLEKMNPARLETGVGGNGVLALFEGEDAGERVLIRSDMDALPIHEVNDVPYRSLTDGVAHKCGHDGHMSILLGLAARLSDRPPAAGSVLLLFQPSEETGQGSARMLADPRLSELRPDYVFALHNLPGFPLHSVIVRDHQFASASQGVILSLHGRSSHAAEPEKGDSPALAAASLITQISTLPQIATGLEQAAKATVIHAIIGERAFGTSPGEAQVMATLRAHRSETVRQMEETLRRMLDGTASSFRLSFDIEKTEVFPDTTNDPVMVDHVRTAARAAGRDIIERSNPFPWSEDFGHFTARYPGCLFGLGAGTETPALHNPDYDFPDELIPTGVALFEKVVRQILG